MTAVKPRLSRQYVYAPLAQLNIDLSTVNVHQIAFMDDAITEPDDQGNDWLQAIVVTSGHDLFKPEIGDALVALAGPDRGDTVQTKDLPSGRYLVWTDWSVPGSDERVVDWHGFVDVVTAPGDD